MTTFNRLPALHAAHFGCQVPKALASGIICTHFVVHSQLTFAFIEKGFSVTKLESWFKTIGSSWPRQARALLRWNSGQLCLLLTTILSCGTMGQSCPTVRTTDQSKAWRLGGGPDFSPPKLTAHTTCVTCPCNMDKVFWFYTGDRTPLFIIIFCNVFFPSQL